MSFLVWVSVIVSVLCCGVVSCKKNKKVEENPDDVVIESEDSKISNIKNELLTEDETFLDEIESEFQTEIEDEFEEEFDDDETDWIDVTETIESEEQNLTDSNARLRMLKFEDEIFIPEKRNGEQVLISSDGQKVRRSFYDDKYRIVKNELWKISDLKNSVVIKSEEFVYDGDSLSPSEKTVENNDSVVKTYFNADGTSRKTEKYKYVIKKSDNKDSDDEEKIKYLYSVVEWQYNGAGKIISEIAISYEYSDDDYSSPSSISKKRQVYTYNDNEEIPPDYECYENEKLRIKTVYAKKDEYRTDTFFDSDYTVRAFYKDSKKVKENYYQNDVLIRSKNYE